jgi:peptidoglycan hydrolase FlgJ
MAIPLALDPHLGAAATVNQIGGRGKVPSSVAEKARANAQDFESVFLSTMFQHMFTDVSGDGPMGGGPAVGVWRSFLTDEYAKNFAKNGGIGIADHVYRALMERQASQTQNTSPVEHARIQPSPQ